MCVEPELLPLREGQEFSRLGRLEAGPVAECFGVAVVYVGVFINVIVGEIGLGQRGVIDTRAPGCGGEIEEEAGGPEGIALDGQVIPSRRAERPEGTHDVVVVEDSGRVDDVGFFVDDHSCVRPERLVVAGLIGNIAEKADPVSGLPSCEPEAEGILAGFIPSPEEADILDVEIPSASPVKLVVKVDFFTFDILRIDRVPAAASLFAAQRTEIVDERAIELEIDGAFPDSRPHLAAEEIAVDQF